ncbi:hypothetical protein [Staphylococcus pettenkoferi]|uniref:hypothetical protein n=1 Tax=Staphylococcus pettenkoferi TaxID=170573 RepID=UPI0002432D4D|nr:hypothetical protein [Staphylococcus pettenkoferi]ASE36416.1 hypothetical protein CEP67_03555 [Staphylococcus pettenkoferi]EHM72066.1 hypothetical protein SEVCU012_1344 [Staphylococcus pettenkoferi VCU012]MCY1579627.1 hypothetical protein [Staphylococcus pettenkoferi]MCY1620090.1 hypothetical protein [Staphylococcus pettenkoferi]
MLYRNWKWIMLAAFIVNLISIKGFPMALGAVYMPILFKVIQMQLNLSKGLVDDVTGQAFIKSNKTGVIISVICCVLITGILFKALDGFYHSLHGFLGVLITLSPVTLVIGLILFILTAVAIVQAVKAQFAHVRVKSQ